MSKMTAGLVSTVASFVLIAAIGSAFALRDDVRDLKLKQEINKTVLEECVSRETFENRGLFQAAEHSEIIRRFEGIEDRLNR